MKRIATVILTLALVLTLAACTAAPAVNSPATSPTAAGWSVSVEGASKTALTQADFAALKATTIDATKKKKDGSTETNKYTGALISDVLTALGVTDFTTLTLTAADGFSADITKDMLSDKAILATQIDGKDLAAADGPVMSVLDGQASKTWVKAITKITVK
jgi:hypothetical protein